MFKKFAIIMSLTAQVGSAYASSVSPSILQCYNDESMFKIVNEANPRNSATHKVTDFTGDLPFEGNWLWSVSREGGFSISINKFQTMNGGILTMMKQIKRFLSGF